MEPPFYRKLYIPDSGSKEQTYKCEPFRIVVLTRSLHVPSRLTRAANLNKIRLISYRQFTFCTFCGVRAAESQESEECTYCNRRMLKTAVLQLMKIIRTHSITTFRHAFVRRVYYSYRCLFVWIRMLAIIGSRLMVCHWCPLTND